MFFQKKLDKYIKFLNFFKNKKMSNEKKSFIEVPDMVDDSKLQEITDKVKLKAFLEDDEIMGKHIVLYINKGEDESTAVGVSVHPTVSSKLLQKLKEDNILK